MLRFLPLALCAIALLAWPQEAPSQDKPSGTGTKSAAPSAAPLWIAQNHIGGVRVGVGVSAGAPNAAANSSFPARLGSTVGLQAVPPVTMPPGVGNINHPGMQPLPLTPQPSPTGLAPPPIPNINFPGGSPGSGGNMPANPSDGSLGAGHGHSFPRGHFRGPFVGFGTVIVGVPVYPYTVYVTTPTYTTPTEQAPYAGQPSAPVPQSVITLLAFKDGTIFAVLDYWLEGDYLRYITLQGIRASVPLDRLALPLTQQLNRERQVRFILEARP